MNSKFLKTIGVLFAIIAVLITAISAFLQTEYSKKTIKNLLEKVISGATKQTFSIGEIDIDFIRGIKLKEVSLRIDEEPFAYIEQASLRYSLPLLLNSSTLYIKTIPIESVSVTGLRLNLIQDSNGNWNFDKIGGEKIEKDKKDPERTKSFPPWSVILRKVLVDNAEIKIVEEGKNKTSEIDIDRLDFSLSLYNISKKIELYLNSASLKISPHDINIAELSTAAFYTTNRAEVKNLRLNLNGAEVKLDGEVNDFKQPEFKLKASAHGYQVKELGTINAEIEGSGKYISRGDIEADIRVRMPESQIKGRKVSALVETIKMDGTGVEINDGVVKTDFGQTSFSGHLDLEQILTKKETNQFDLKVSLEDLQASEIFTLIPEQKLPEIINKTSDARLNANFEANGEWQEIKDLRAKIIIDKLGLQGKELGEVDLTGRIEASKSDLSFDLVSKLIDFNLASVLSGERYSTDLNSNLELKGSLPLSGDIKDKLEARVDIIELRQKGRELGDIDLKGTMEMARSNLQFDLVSRLNKVNLAPILNDQRYKSDINSNLNLKGSLPLNADLIESLSASVRAEVLPSTFSDLKISRGRIDTSYYGQVLNVSTLWLTSDAFKLEAKGKGTKLTSINFDYNVQVNDLNFISKLKPELQLEGTLKAEGTVQGKIKNPRIITSATASDFGYKKDMDIKSIKISGEATLDPENPRVQLAGNLEEIRFKDREIKSAQLQATSTGKEITGNISILEDEDPKKIYEARLKLTDFKGEEKNLLIEKIKLSLQDSIIENRDPINVAISPNRLTVRSFNLYHKENSVLGDADINFTGAVKADLRLGTINFSDISEVYDFEHPLRGTSSGYLSLRGTLEVPEINANIDATNLEFRGFKSDRTNINLSYLNNRLDFGLFITKDAKQIFQADGSANISLNLKEIKESLETAEFDLTLKSGGVDLSPISMVSKEIKEINGIGVIDLRASGNLRNPTINGQLRLQEVSLRLGFLRNELRIATGIIEMEGQRGFLRTLEIQTGEGKATLQGDFDLQQFSYNLNGKMDNFRMEPQGISARLDGNVNIEGSEGRLNITGNARVRRARIRIPDLPDKEVEDIKFVDEEEEEFTIEASKPTDYFRDNVAMDVKASMRGNVWVRGRGANVELRGNVGIIKRYGDPLILTGNINTVRGTYEFLGKLFRIDEGLVSFQGTPEINPFLNIKAQYRVSNVDISVNIGGTAKKPEIKLSSNPTMEETDILSYLVFGTSSDRLGAGQRISLQQQAGEVLGGIAAGELKGIVGDKFALDVISVRAGESGPEVEVGKYLTDDLYVAYERGTSQASTAAPVPTNSVLVEYRLFDFLTLSSEVGGEQAGGDVFFQFDYSCPLFQRGKMNE